MRNGVGLPGHTSGSVTVSTCKSCHVCTGTSVCPTVFIRHTGPSWSSSVCPVWTTTPSSGLAAAPLTLRQPHQMKPHRLRPHPPPRRRARRRRRGRPPEALLRAAMPTWRWRGGLQRMPNSLHSAHRPLLEPTSACFSGVSQGLQSDKTRWPVPRPLQCDSATATAV